MANESSSTAVEWEMSKENVQPLRQGRKVANLTAALKPLTRDQLSKIKEQRQAFEEELRTYRGDDPLDVWYRYIKWTEDNYPTGGKDGHMLSLLEKCVTTFKDNEQYRNDQRYLGAWIKFASQSSHPLEAYTFLYDQGIGCELACLYEAWTWELEQTGNTKRADALYMEGINRGVQPLDHLERAHREFQARVVRQATEDLSEVSVMDSAGEDRTALTELKGHGKHKTVGSIRPTGAPRQAPRGQGLKRSTGVVPIASVSSYSRPNYTVHADDNVEHSMTTPMKPPAFGNTILSARKPSKEPTLIEQLSQQHDPSLVPMYCKDLVYSGLEEYQFEKIREVRWRAHKKEQDRREEERRYQDGPVWADRDNPCDIRGVHEHLPGVWPMEDDIPFPKEMEPIPVE